MPVMKTIPISNTVKVAAIFDLDKITPAWFQLPRQKPIRVTSISSIWYNTNGARKLINFEVAGEDHERYCLTYDPTSLAWSLGKTVYE